VTGMIAQLVERRASNPEVALWEICGP
jgi:hypothetical protein